MKCFDLCTFKLLPFIIKYRQREPNCKVLKRKVNFVIYEKFLLDVEVTFYNETIAYESYQDIDNEVWFPVWKYFFVTLLIFLKRNQRWTNCFFCYIQRNVVFAKTSYSFEKVCKKESLTPLFLFFVHSVIVELRL